MHDDRELVEERITRELTERVLPLVHPERRPLAVEAGPTPDMLDPFAVGRRWGPPWATTWFRFTGEVPAAGRVAASRRCSTSGSRPTRRASSARASCATARADPCRASTRGARRWPSPASQGPSSSSSRRPRTRSSSQFLPSPLGSPDTAGTEPLYRLDRAELVRVDTDAEALLHDLDVLDSVMRTLPLDDPRRARHPRARSCGRSTSSPARRVAATTPSSRRAPRSRRRLRCRPDPAPTGSSRPATPTSTPRGCGRCARRCASARGRSPRRSP